MANTLIIFLTLVSLSGLVLADDQLAQTVCHLTDTPTVCIECLRSDPNADLTSKTGIAASVISCLRSQGSALVSEMAKIASGSSDSQAKSIFNGCRASYSGSNKNLEAAVASVKGKKYDDAERAVSEALYRQYSCFGHIKEYGKVELDSKVVYKMRIYEDLCQAAERIIERL